MGQYLRMVLSNMLSEYPLGTRIAPLPIFQLYDHLGSERAIDFNANALFLQDGKVEVIANEEGGKATLLLKPDRDGC
jgi:hypothetical protein